MVGVAANWTPLARCCWTCGALPSGPAGPFHGALHIPLPELRARRHELPQDKEIIVRGQSGQRSHFACRLLAQRGFNVRNLTGAWRTWHLAAQLGGCG